MELPEFFNRTRQPLRLPESPFTAEGAAPPPPPGGGPPPSKILNFNMEFQTQDRWCWAAVAVSVSRFYDPNSVFTQCSVANGIFPRPVGVNCCVQPGQVSPCNGDFFLDKALAHTRNLRLPLIPRAATPNELVNEHNNNRVIGCHITWKGGGGHFTVLRGFSTKTVGNITEFRVHVSDPLEGNGNSEYPYDSFRTRYTTSLGVWDFSYPTKP